MLRRKQPHHHTKLRVAPDYSKLSSKSRPSPRFRIRLYLVLPLTLALIAIALYRAASDTDSFTGESSHRILLPVRPGQHADTSGSATYTIAPGDSLSLIARRVYGDATKWKVILDANKDRLAHPQDLKVGMELTIPPAAD